MRVDWYGARSAWYRVRSARYGRALLGTEVVLLVRLVGALHVHRARSAANRAPSARYGRAPLGTEVVLLVRLVGALHVHRARSAANRAPSARYGRAPLGFRNVSQFDRFPKQSWRSSFVNHNLFQWILTEEAAKWHSRPTLSTGKKDTLGAHQCQFSVPGETGKRTFQDPIRDNN